MASSVKKKTSKNTQTIDANYVTELLLKIATVVFIYALFIILPIGYRDYYFDIGMVKYVIFIRIFAIYCITSTILLVPYTIVHIKSGSWKSYSIKEIVKTLTVVDWFMLVYGILCIVSFFCSEFHSFSFFNDYLSNGILKNMAWYGFKDWYMGLRTQLLLVVAYFYVSRFFVKDFFRFEYVIWIFLVMSFVFLIAVLNRLNIDPLGFYENINNVGKLLFLTTIGQASWYSSFLATIIPLGIAFYFFCDGIIEKVLYGTFLCFGFMSLVSQNSDSSFFAIVVVFITLFMFSFKDNDSIKSFLEIILIMLISARFMGLLMKIFAGSEIQLDILSQILLHNPAIWIFIVLLAGFYGFLIYNDKNDDKLKFDIKKYSFIRYIVLVVFIISLVLAICLVILATNGMIVLPEGLPSGIKNYLVFDETWGNARGSIWALSVEIFKTFKPLYKIFGCGSDCYGYYAFKYLSDFMGQYKLFSNGLAITNSHNEWFTMLINNGITGAIAYLGIFVSSFVLFIKESKQNKMLFAVALGVIAYIVHGIFCYQTVVNTPFIIVEIAIAVFLLRNKNCE